MHFAPQETVLVRCSTKPDRVAMSSQLRYLRLLEDERALMSPVSLFEGFFDKKLEQNLPHSAKPRHRMHRRSGWERESGHVVVRRSPETLK